MAIRSKEFIEIAEGIRSHEVSLKSKIESLEGTLTGLHHSQSSLEQRLSSLFSELHMVSSCSDEDDLPDYAAIARVEMEISGTQAELAEVNDEITVTELELSQTQDEYDEVEEEKQQTLFEIEQRAQISAQNISVVSGMYGAYADVGASLQQTFQSGFDSLVQASRILGGNISAFQGSSQGGSSHSPGSIGSTSRISGSVSTGTGKTSTFISGANSAFSGKPSSNSFMSGQIGINHPSASISIQQNSTNGTSASALHSSQSSVLPSNTSAIVKQDNSANRISSKQTSISKPVSKSLPNASQNSVKVAVYQSNLGNKMDTLRKNFVSMKAPELKSIIRSDKLMNKLRRGTMRLPKKSNAAQRAHLRKSRNYLKIAKGYVQEDMLRYVLKDDFELVSSTTTKSNINNTLTDIIVYRAKRDTQIGNIVIRKGKNLSIESKSGSSTYLRSQITHIAQQLEGMPRNSYRMLIITADYKKLSEKSKGRLTQVLSAKNATMYVLPYTAHSLDNALKQTKFPRSVRKPTSRVKKYATHGHKSLASLKAHGKQVSGHSLSSGATKTGGKSSKESNVDGNGTR